MRFRGLSAAFVMVLAASAPARAEQAWGKTDVKQGWGDAPAKKAAPASTSGAKKPAAPAAAAAKTGTATRAAKPATAPAPAPASVTAPDKDAHAEPAPAGPSVTAPAGRAPAPGVLLPQAPQAAAPAAAKASAPKKKASVPVTARWVDLQAATAAVRYRDIETSAGLRTANQMQTRDVVKGRVKLDRAGAYSVNVGLATGTSITGGWNTTGVGTGPGVTNMYLKTFYFAGVPTKGVELQYGGISPLRGDNTEITSYDDDVYLAGERASIKRPKQWFFDDVSLTQAYLGDKTTPGFFNRYERLSESNYHQILFGKKVGKAFSASTDYTRVSGVGTVRAGIAYKRALVLIDSVRFEQYRRLGPGGAYGYSLYGEKAFGKVATFGTGWASIDPDYGGLNGDRYAKGRRVYAGGSLNVSPELAVSGFFTRALANDYPVPNATRFDLILTYNVLKTLQKAGLF